MSRYDLTKTVLRQGVWQGVLTAKEGADTPQISVTHEGKEVTDITLEAEGSEGRWTPLNMDITVLFPRLTTSKRMRCLPRLGSVGWSMAKLAEKSTLP